MSAIYKVGWIMASLASIVLFGAYVLPQHNNTIAVSDTELPDADFDTMTISQVYKKLGKLTPEKLDASVKGASIERGRDLVFKGQTIGPDGKKTSIQSKYYTCTACHNTVKEFADLRKTTAEERLKYARENEIPFLQASSFYGAVNRTNFYNGEYQTKYAGVDKIKEAKTDIRAAIQVCATTCSQGRALTDWELESIMAYFWSIELRVRDLELSKEEREVIKTAITDLKGNHKAVHILEDAFDPIRDAHFIEPLEDQPVNEAELTDEKRLADGKAIYELSCLHCHYGERYSFFGLDNSRVSFKHLDKATRKAGRHDLYHITRHGTYPRKGRQAYMPQYTKEKLSDQQLRSLRIYVHARAEGKLVN